MDDLMLSDEREYVTVAVNENRNRMNLHFACQEKLRERNTEAVSLGCIQYSNPASLIKQKCGRKT